MFFCFYLKTLSKTVICSDKFPLFFITPIFHFHFPWLTPRQINTLWHRALAQAERSGRRERRGGSEGHGANVAELKSNSLLQFFLPKMWVQRLLNF